MLGFLPSQPSVWNIRRRKKASGSLQEVTDMLFFLLLKAADEMNIRTHGLEFAHRAHFLDERQIFITQTHCLDLLGLGGHNSHHVLIWF